MNFENDENRKCALHQTLSARTEEEVAVAIQQLDQWMQDHPDDQSIRDAYEPLTLRQMAFRQSAPPLALT